MVNIRTIDRNQGQFSPITWFHKHSSGFQVIAQIDDISEENRQTVDTSTDDM